MDLGCHDGYVSLWVARQLRERGIEPLIDGIELNPAAVDAAQKRFEADGFDATFAVGDALSPHRHFKARTYDVVIAYELIEHVPAPQDLLTAAERMVTKDGRIYVSTPDGTFGTGGNPHHLRALRAHDLADLLRRSGELHDMTVGTDGVTVASYSPSSRRGDIAIFTGPGWETWTPHDIALKGLGGSETAAVRLAQQLSARGYVVTIYGDVEQCCFQDVIYRHWSVFDPQDRRLAVISSRLPELFDRPMNAQTTMLWLHDVDAADRLTQDRADRIDHVLTLSRWHENHVGDRYPFLREKIRRIRNGIELGYFEGDELERKRRVLYTSSPDRGLDVLLERIWPKVLERVPDAEFAFCYSDVYQRVAEQDPAIGEHRDKITKLADQEGVKSLGSLSQPELAELMCSSLVWTHPSWSTPTGEAFHETSCIGAMEAQAAGCLVVASDWGALKETVQVGRLINSQPLGPRWVDGFVRSIIEGLTDVDVQAWAQTKGPEYAATLGWDGVAKQVAGLVDGEVFAFKKPLT